MSAGDRDWRRILVTGAGGFVGQWLLPELRARVPAGAVIASGARPGESSRAADKSFTFDVTKPDEVLCAIKEFNPSCIIHLAAIATIREARADTAHAWSVNVDGARNVAEAALRFSPDAVLIHVGSADAYGASFRASAAPLDETAPLRPENPYAETKAAADALMLDYAAKGLHTLRLRPFNHTGPGQGVDNVLPSFAAQIARIEAGLQAPVMRVGNLEARRDFLDVRDVVAAYASAVLRGKDFAPGAALNIASGTPRRIGDCLDMMLAQARVAISIESDPALFRLNDTQVAAGDAGRASAALDWRPRFAWETTLKDVLDDARTRLATAPSS